jgi:predicted TIM-barrel fold metal-dependent hydrolase
MTVEVTAVDCHAHVMLVDRPLSPLRHSSPKRDVPVEEYIALIDSQGISHGLLTAPSFYGTDNSLLLEALAAFPDRLRGTVIVDPKISEKELRTMREQGVCGVRLNWLRLAALPDPGSAAYQRHFGMLRELGLHVEIFLEGPLLRSVLPKIRASGVRVVLDHFGCPDPAEGVEGAAFRGVLDAVAAGDVWVKLSAPYRLGGADPQRYVDALLHAGGPGQLVWASDWPFVGHEDRISYRQCVEWLEEWVPSEATRRTIVADTPRALFGF